jgi:iron complex outermembrane receptor protein
LGAVYRYSSAFASAASTTTSLRSTPIKQLDLSLDWLNIVGKPIDLAFYGTNVTDQFTRGVILPLFNSFGFDARYVGPPRMYGARFRVRFGAAD